MFGTSPSGYNSVRQGLPKPDTSVFGFLFGKIGVVKRITFVTSNKGKYSSAKRFLKKYGITVIQRDAEIPESRGNLEEIAVHKARHAFKLIKEPLIVMDAGFFIPSLNGFPMMFTNFVLETIGNEGILKLVKGEDRTCRFKEVLCYHEGGHKKPRLFKRFVEGTIASRPRGRVKPYHWSKLALIFIPKGEKKTMAEMTDREFAAFRKTVDNRSHWEQFGKFYSKLN